MGDGVSGEVIHGPSQRVRVDNGLFQSRHRRHVAISDWILAAVSKEGVPFVFCRWNCAPSFLILVLR
jgi:hypothetical protein